MISHGSVRGKERERKNELTERANRIWGKRVRRKRETMTTEANNLDIREVAKMREIREKQ